MTKKRKRKPSLCVLTHASDGGTANEIDADSIIDELKLNSEKNPLYREQQSFLSSITPKERDFYFSQSADSITPDRRAELWMKQADIGEALVNKYAWATPTKECLKIFREFSPIVEIGSGSNAYWAKYMETAGIDVVAYDMNPQDGGKIHPEKASGAKTPKRKIDKPNGSLVLRKGGPEVLKLPELKNHSLFLCYPDEEDGTVPLNDELNSQEEGSRQPLSFGWQCLSEYEGTYVIHVGELAILGDANLNMEQSPWGRSSSPEFQQRLASEFHCIAKICLPNWLHVRDSISVWKRSQICEMVFVDDDDEEGEGEEIIEYRHIPPEERLPRSVIAPCIAKLLAPCQPPKKKSISSVMTGIGKKNGRKMNESKIDCNNIASDTANEGDSKDAFMVAKIDSIGENHDRLESKKTKRGLRRERQKRKKMQLKQHSSSQTLDHEDRYKKREEKEMRSEYFRVHGTLPRQS